MNQNDSHNRNFNGLILVLNGEFEAATGLVEPHLDKLLSGNIDIDRNIYAVSNFHLGNYTETIRAIEEITTKGGSSGALTLAYLAAAYYATGNESHAAKLVARIKVTWPKYDPKKYFSRFHRFQKHADQIITGLKNAGWQ